MSGFSSSSLASATRRFSPPEVADHGVPGRQAQRVGGDFHLVSVSEPAVAMIASRRGLFFGQLVEVGVLGRRRRHRPSAWLGLHHFADAGFDFLAHGLGRVELRLLRQVADGHAGQMLDLAVVFLVDAGHDAGTVDLPAPLRPSRPILAPGKKEREMSLMIWRLGGTLLTRSMDATY